MNLKGVSPLVATLLLIALSISLGIIVMMWGETYIEKKAQFVRDVRDVFQACDDVSIQFIMVGGKPQACIKDGSFEIFVDNGPKMDLADIHTRVLGRTPEEEVSLFVQENTLEEPLKKAEAARLSISLEGLGKLVHLKLIPKLIVNEKPVLCEDKSLVIEEFRDCK